jgi:hypothetical protein
VYFKLKIIKNSNTLSHLSKIIHIKPHIIHFVICACCGGKITLLFMGVVAAITLSQNL